VNLARRFTDYFNINYISDERYNMLINKALLKHGYANFTVEILEYCELDKLRSREQHFLDLLEPEYNMLKTAGSLLGFKHSEETIAKLKARFKDRVFTSEHLENLSAGKIGNKNGTGGKGRKRAEGAGSPSVQVEVFNLETGIKTIYPSMSEAGQALGVPSGNIRMYLSRNSKKPYKGIYFWQKLAG
jgi:group I intron endonuclease